ncbi:uncharacterized protein LOC110735013 [Chenopodium quinoa]|uniref:uncharacterized protein LOC110735013 n=1 Tax=Chenopodium quinoa TaxID=63459 RepID=UPI000B7708B4|nr:uncharacterized protein LOC110735013 [Chenopodium quinoa]
MGASESTISSSIKSEDQITTVSERIEDADPILDRLKSLKIATPILTAPPAESSLTDLLVRKSLSSSKHGTLNPKVILDLFSMYRDWQEDKAYKISCRQDEIENKIEVVDALAVKLLQRFNGSVSTMKTASQHLSEVHALQVELGELKGRLTEVISNCDTLCRRIASDGPESLRSSVMPFSASNADVNIKSNLCPGVRDTSQPSNKAGED